jgi:molybdopterin/thiamine biosynthesis adenylyltransferase
MSDLSPATVVLAGAGNIGSPLASLIACARPRLLRIIDRDRVEEKNLRVQDFEPVDVGRPKAEALVRRLRRRFPGQAIEAVCADLEDVPLGLFEADILLGGLDSRRARQVLLSEIAWPLGVPVVDGGVGADWCGRVQVFVPGDGGACLECTWGREDYRLLSEEYPCVPGGAARAAPTGAPAFLGAAVASTMAAEAVRLLSGPRPEASYEIAFDLRHRRYLESRLRRAKACRFDHEVVGSRVALGRAFEGTTGADLLGVIDAIAQKESVHLECRRRLFDQGGFGASRLVPREALEGRRGEPLAALGLTAADRLRVRGPRGSAFILLGETASRSVRAAHGASLRAQ